MFTITQNRVLTSLFLTLGAALAGSQPLHAAEPIHWRTGEEAVTPMDASGMAEVLTTLGARGNERHLVVQLAGPLTAAKRQALQDSGLTLLNYIGSHAFFATMAAGGVDAEAVAQSGVLIDARAIQREWRLHQAFLTGDVPEFAIAPVKEGAGSQEPIAAAYVLFHPDVPLVPNGVNIVAQYGAKVRSHLKSINGLVIELPLVAVTALADEDAVQWIEPPLPQLSEMNDSNRAITGADIVQAPPYNLDGSGVTVMMYDGGYARASHVDFQGRLTVRDSSGMSDHATHVSGTIGGAGVANPLYKGMAPGVTIESYGFEQEGGLQEGFLYTDPGDLEADYSEAVNMFGADISNNSIGTNTAPNGFPCEWTGDYGVTSALIDSVVRGSLGAPHRVIWANGNERQTSRCGSFYNTTAPPACAKNHITVGAMNSNDDSVTSFTSWGPADDGRLKPDISGPGCQSNGDGTVTSCSSSSDTSYTGKCGTSMACPTVTGLSALLLQDYRAHFPLTPDPRNSTLKAIFANTAQDIENVGPDYKTGYGSVRIQPAIDLMRAENFTEAEVSQGEVFSALIIVEPGDPQMKVTIAWDDVPATPNVIPSIVNDLDLVVYDPSGVLRFPWTLDPIDPEALAVQTQADHINNIEQVAVDFPAAGAWRIDVIGFNVPIGPQVFSMAVSPLLVNCSRAGITALDKAKYSCSGPASIRVTDCDLNTDDGAVETITVTIVSDSEAGGETVLLTETAAESATFTGSIPMSTIDAGGVLQIAHGDAVTVTYIDADDGQGNFGVSVQDGAVVDCVAPLINSVTASNIEPRSATITFNTDEAAQGTVRYGVSCGALNDTAGGGAFQTAHSVALSGLQDATTYFYAVEAVDEAGNAATDNNGGSCYTFATPDIPDFFTEQFESNDNDLDDQSITFTPNGTLDFYSACTEAITALPTDPAGGTSVPLADDDFAAISVTGGQVVSLYGVDYSTFYIGSNGYITFDSGDTDVGESLLDHFSLPRISALFDDLNPAAGGAVSRKQLGDRVVVSHESVPEYNTSNSNTFQFEMFFDGRIRMSYLAIAATDGLAGLSEGLGINPDFMESDLSSQSACGPADCNGNGIPDDQDIADGTSEDCNGNGIPDECDLAGAFSIDCNLNTIPDECDILVCSGGDLACKDCNNNGVMDGCDLNQGTEQDCNGNARPDSCDIANCLADPACADCNGNAVPDGCDLASGTSEDCNTNLVPDSCDIAGGTSEDCNANAVPDSCDLASGTAEDCNTNLVPDSCDVAGGASADCNSNAAPDECDIADGTSNDDNANTVPDECDVTAPLLSALGSRYLEATAQPAGLAVPVALLITGDAANPDVSCLSQYIQPDGTLGAAAVFQTAIDWGTVTVTGGAVLPNTIYRAQAELTTGLLPAVTTATTWRWGDADNDGAANFGDILQVVKGFQGDLTGAALEALDLEPCSPDGEVTFDDVLQAVSAFQQVDFACPVPCP